MKDRFLFAPLLAVMLAGSAVAQQRAAPGHESIRGFLDQVEEGLAVTAKIDDKRTARLVFAREGWGGRPEDVAAVCVSCAETIFTAIKPEPGREPTVLVIRDPQGPIALTQRGPDGQVIVLLSTGDRRWSQVAYQFSHELGHVLCGDLTLTKPQRWFEESFCESLSLWTMDKMGIAWKTRPPYPNWKSYAPHLSEYIGKVRDRAATPKSLADWYRKQRDHLTAEPYDRPKNLIPAKQLAAEAHQNANFYQAFIYLRRPGKNQADTLPWLLVNWHSHCPAELKFAPARVAELLEIELPKEETR